MIALPDDVVAWVDRPELEPMQVASLAIGSLRGSTQLLGFRDLLSERGDDPRSKQIIALIDQALSARERRQLQ